MIDREAPGCVNQIRRTSKKGLVEVPGKDTQCKHEDRGSRGVGGGDLWVTSGWSILPDSQPLLIHQLFWQSGGYMWLWKQLKASLIIIGSLDENLQTSVKKNFLLEKHLVVQLFLFVAQINVKTFYMLTEELELGSIQSVHLYMQVHVPSKLSKDCCCQRCTISCVCVQRNHTPLHFSDFGIEQNDYIIIGGTIPMHFSAALSDQSVSQHSKQGEHFKELTCAQFIIYKSAFWRL